MYMQQQYLTARLCTETPLLESSYVHTYISVTHQLSGSMESYPDPNPNAGDRADAYYTSTSNAIAQLQEENMMNMGHNIAPAMHGQGGIPDQQDSRSHDQINQSFQNSSQLPHHLNSQGHIQSGHGGLAQIPLHYDSPEASGSARKRSKVSRACDECRRKKIKCDAQSEEGPCSNCRRSSVECQFSRVPQKRGPSKGYEGLTLQNMHGTYSVCVDTSMRLRSELEPSNTPAMTAFLILDLVVNSTWKMLCLVRHGMTLEVGKGHSQMQIRLGNLQAHINNNIDP